MFNHVHCLQDVDSLSSPKYLGARYIHSGFVLKERFYFISHFMQMEFLSHSWPWPTTSNVNVDGEFQFSNHY